MISRPRCTADESRLARPAGRPPDQIGEIDVHDCWQALAAPLLLEEHTDEIVRVTPLSVSDPSKPPAASG